MCSVSTFAVDGPKITLPLLNKPEAVTQGDAPTPVHLGLKWDERERDFSVQITNTSDHALSVFGVNTSHNIFVRKIPADVPAGGRGELLLTYLATGTNSSNIDIVRVRTKDGEKQFNILHDRESVAKLETDHVQWQVGDAADEKIVRLTADVNKAKPVAVRALGVGNKATLKDLGGDRFEIAIKPGSTSAPNQFPVILEFSHELPGANNTIVCLVLPRNS